jgi:hypothetical protein
MTTNNSAVAPKWLFDNCTINTIIPRLEAGASIAQIYKTDGNVVISYTIMKTNSNQGGSKKDKVETKRFS